MSERVKRQQSFVFVLEMLETIAFWTTRVASIRESQRFLSLQHREGEIRLRRRLLHAQKQSFLRAENAMLG